MPAPHAMPHAPQLALSVERSRQTPPQFVWLPPHVTMQLLPLQICPAAHVMLHAPQSSRSVVRSRHVPPQSVSPAPHEV
jgi:hypothetical protein